MMAEWQPARIVLPPHARPIRPVHYGLTRVVVNPASRGLPQGLSWSPWDPDVGLKNTRGATDAGQAHAIPQSGVQMANAVVQQIRHPPTKRP